MSKKTNYPKKYICILCSVTIIGNAAKNSITINSNTLHLFNGVTVLGNAWSITVDHSINTDLDNLLFMIDN